MLKQFLGPRVIPLTLLDIAHVEEAGSVARILLEAFLKIISGFIKSPQMAVGESHEGVGSRGGVQMDEIRELLDGFRRFARHEIALAQSGVQVGALRCDFQA